MCHLRFGFKLGFKPKLVSVNVQKWSHAVGFKVSLKENLRPESGFRPELV